MANVAQAKLKFIQGYGNNFKQLRKSHKMTLEQLGNILHYSDRTLSMIETESRLPTIEQLQAYHDYFNVSFDYLVGETTVTKPEVEAVCKYTGLSEKAVERLHFYAELHKTFSSDSMKYLSDMIVKINPAVLSVQFESIKNESERLVNMLVKYFEKNADDENYAENFAEFETEINNQIEFCDLMRYRAEVSFRDHLNLLDSRNTNYDTWKIVKEKALQA